MHQPNYLPWIGLFGKIKQSDCFVDVTCGHADHFRNVGRRSFVAVLFFLVFHAAPDLYHDNQSR